MTDTPSAPRILLAEDQTFDRMVLQNILDKAGYQVIHAENGREAVEKFQQNSPELVLMDAFMPELDGHQATEQIKQLAGDDFIPVIFLTSLNNAKHVTQCIQSGGDAFISKPVVPEILLAKIEAQLRTRELFLTVKRQKEELDKHHQAEQRDLETAENIFKRIVHLGCLDKGQIPYMTSPAALFNGDILLAARTPTDMLRIMVGDFTGHGLSAAVGAIPTSEIFYQMTREGYSLSEVIRAINNKLHDILPVGIFCAAGFVETDYQETIQRIWVGGIPDIIRYSDSPRKIIAQHASSHVPLGILSDAQFNSTPQTIQAKTDETLLIRSDGLDEYCNANGEIFGQERILKTIEDCPEDTWASPFLLRALDKYGKNANQKDDMTLIELPCGLNNEQQQKINCHTNKLTPSKWTVKLRLDGDTLKNATPIPLLLENITELQDLAHHRANLYTILSELFNNTIEHGLLGLDASLKQSAEGFAEFYRLREQRLAELNNRAFIAITLKNTPSKKGGRLLLRLDDSSEGFNPDALPDSSLKDTTRYHGRGIPLLRNLCHSLVYHPPGNRVEAIYKWE